MVLQYNPTPADTEASHARSDKDTAAKCLLVVAGTKGVRCFTEFSEEKIARTEWGHKFGSVWMVQIIERNCESRASSLVYPYLAYLILACRALVAFTDKHVGLVYSLPALELLHTLDLPATSTLSALISLLEYHLTRSHLGHHLLTALGISSQRHHSLLR